MTSVTVIGTIPKNSSEEVRVSLDEFKGTKLIDIRVFAEFSDGGERKPTKKGVAIKIDRLPALIEAMHDAEAEARRRGLLGGIE